jgi:molybdate transport system substrate-binding protein
MTSTRPHPRLGPVLVATLAGALFLAGCGSSGGRSKAATSTTASSGSTATSKLQGDITVSAAASLTETFDQEIAAFEAAHPGTEVTATYDSSSILVDQITSGADVDVFASADTDNMDKVVAAGLNDGAPEPFAGNELVIVTKPGNPEGIKTLADLAGAGVVALCDKKAPCGKYAAQVLEHAEIDIPESSVTRGQNAKTTLAAVTAGDATAAIVYVTDAKTIGSKVDTVAIADADNVIATLPIAVLGKQADPVATAFVAYVQSDAGQQILEKAGFLPPA